MNRSTKRSAGEVGELIRARREACGLSQDDIPDVSSATMRKIENASAESFKPRTLRKVATALDWPPDAYARLLAGASMDDLRSEVRIGPSDRDRMLTAIDAIEQQVRALRGELESQR